MKSAGTVNFVDKDSSDEAFAIVRYDTTTIGLGLSLKASGDIEVFMDRETATKLIELLQHAVADET